MYEHTERKTCSVASRESELALVGDWHREPFPPLPDPVPLADPILQLKAELNALTQRVQALENGEMLRAGKREGQFKKKGDY